MSVIEYPRELPCPRFAPMQWAERRVLSSLPGPRKSRPFSRDQFGTQSVEFIFNNGDELQTWLNWLSGTLVDCGAWFVASWPLPGGEDGVRRFVGAPSYPQYFANVGWRVQAQVQIRGRGMLPAPPPCMCEVGRDNVPLPLRDRNNSLVQGDVTYTVTPATGPVENSCDDLGFLWSLRSIEDNPKFTNVCAAIDAEAQTYFNSFTYGGGGPTEIRAVSNCVVDIEWISSIEVQATYSLDRYYGYPGDSGPGVPGWIPATPSTATFDRT